MRSLFELSRFELHLQGRSALFLALLMVISAAHFFTARKLGINIALGAEADAQTLPLNSTLAIIQNELVLSLLAVFPAVALVATATTRDRERRTEEMIIDPLPSSTVLIIATSAACIGLFKSGSARSLTSEGAMTVARNRSAFLNWARKEAMLTVAKKARAIASPDRLAQMSCA